MSKEQQPGTVDRKRVDIATYRKAIDTLVDRTLATIEQKYERNPYHNTRHAKAVIERSVQILQAIKAIDPTLVSEYDIEDARVNGAKHDEIYETHSEKKREADGVSLMRKRNDDVEKRSADKLAEDKTRLNQELGQPVFSAVGIQTGKQAIMATVPDWSEELGTIIQPNLGTAEAPLIPLVIALAAADLAAGGMKGLAGETAAQEGKRVGSEVFREENFDIAKAFKRGKPLTQEKGDFFKRRMITWSERQVRFYQGQKTRLPDLYSKIEDPHLRQVMQEVITELFSEFDSTIAAAQQTLEARQKMSLNQLFEDFGYQKESPQ